MPTELAIIEDLERKLQATDQIKKYIFAGRATFTLRSVATQKRYTFKMSRSKKKGEEQVFFLLLMYGNNNENDFRLIGVVRGDRGSDSDRNGKGDGQGHAYRPIRNLRRGSYADGLGRIRLGHCRF